MIEPMRSVTRAYQPGWLLGALAEYLLSDLTLAMRFRYRESIRSITRADVAISIGGDNYCYQSRRWLYAVDAAVKKAGKKLVLWGCSIEPEDIFQDRELRHDLARFDLITPRETITYHALLEAGVNDNVHIHADPAFVVQSEPTDLPDGWEEDNVIGLNLSPLILRYQTSTGDLMLYASSLVKHILRTTQCQVALIPHVVQSGNNDWEVLNELYQDFSGSKRVLLLSQGFKCQHIKHVISKCRLFIGARTHSTIAAYSTYVPALALGYSVKARGIARDIFGSEEGLVLPIQRLTASQQLIDAFEGLRCREDELRAHLTATIPAYVQSAWDAGADVVKLCQQ